MLKKYFLFLFFIISSYSFSQGMQLSVYSKISVITYGPGDALYEKFGHTAIRIQDPVLQLDLVYNYGFFDLKQENFYVNFTKGYMKYRLVRNSFSQSMRVYQYYQRWVKEQILNLNVQQRNTFFRYLENNAQPENASYFYDPFFNNCSTKPVDIMKDIFGDTIIYKDDFIAEENTIRELMNKEIHTNTWGSLGINIALGNRLDKTAKPSEYMYLPDYVFAALENSKIIKDGKEENLVLKTNTLLENPEKTINSDLISPLLVFLVLLIIGGYISFKDLKRGTRSRWFDRSLLLITGLFGILIVFLWFFTNHSTAPNNFNFLWAFAPNFFLAFVINKKNPPKWIYSYIKFLLILLGLIPIIWLLNFQLFPYVLIPLFVLLALRYWIVLKLQKALNT